jgi:phenylalanyl-tRNA synthetase beta chain
MLRILTSLGISTEGKENTFLVYPPAHRRDIRRDSDVSEEIARIYGYDNIPTTNPKSPLSSGRLKRNLINLRKVREAIRKGGFTEVINYSFMSAPALDLISIAVNDRRRKTVAISNPLSQDECLLRTTLIPALLANMKYNIDRGMKDIRLFEIARVFEDTGGTLPFEEMRLGGIFFRDKFPAFWKEDAQGFFITKGLMEALFYELRISRYRFSPSSEPVLHPGQSADIFLHDTRIGHIGVLAPGIVEKLDLRRHRPDIVLFEINLDLLLGFVPDSMLYSEIPKYPSVERDIALIIQDKIPSATIQELIRTYPSEFIEEVSLFDYFKGGNIPQGKKSLAFNIIYRSKERTLTDQEVEVLHSSLVAYLIEKTGAELRG